MLVVAEEDVGRFYKDFYEFLSSAGVDSVKTDAQFFVDELHDATDRRSLIQSYQDAWNINQLRYFSGKAISCMSQTPQIIFHSQLPSNKPRILVRNSDDFFPEVPGIYQCFLTFLYSTDLISLSSLAYILQCTQHHPEPVS